MSQTYSGLWPRETSSETKSEAEKKVYKALKTSLPKGWYAWHSLKVRDKKKGKFSEADFIFADPKRPSVLILEVKGGQISQRDGQWYQNNRLLKDSPLDQAHDFLRHLTKQFKDIKVEYSFLIPEGEYDNLLKRQLFDSDEYEEGDYLGDGI